MKPVFTSLSLARTARSRSLLELPLTRAACLGAFAAYTGVACAPSDNADRKFDLETSPADDTNDDTGNTSDAGITTGDTKSGTNDVNSSEDDTTTDDDTADESDATTDDESDATTDDESDDLTDEDTTDGTTDDDTTETTSSSEDPTSNDSAPDGGSGDTSDDTSADTTNGVSGDPTNDTVADVADVDTSDDTSVDTSDDTSVDTSGDTSVDTSDDTSVDTSDDTSVDTSDDTSVDTSDDTTDTTDDLPNVPSDIADLEWVIGGEGTGPGLFDDARFLAVDGDGNSYVAEYISDVAPRIQVFNSDGEFVRQWYSEREGFIGGMAATLDGQLYLSQNGYVDRYTAVDGTGMETIPVTTSFTEALAVAPDGGFVLVSSERILRVLSDGTAGTPFDAISQVPTEYDFFYLSGAAVDGSGSVFVVDSMELSIFKFDDYGESYWGRIGLEGEGPGVLESGIDAVATDRYGRVYASDWDGIEVFEPSGSPAGFIELAGAIFAMATNIDDELFVLERNAELLYKFKLRE